MVAQSQNRFFIEPEIYGATTYEEMRTAYSSAKIVLGLHSVDTSPTMMSMRTFEALGCGAFYLTQWTPAVENLFSNHEHLVWSKSPQETVELVEYYLPGPKNDSGLPATVRPTYMRDTYHHRAEEFLKVLRAPASGSRHDYGRCFTVDSNSNQRCRVMKVKRVTINMKIHRTNRIIHLQRQLRINCEEIDKQHCIQAVTMPGALYCAGR